jgi:ABC-type sugar transport system ATPase subunit
MRDGVIQQVGVPADVYGRPANTFVATFVGSPPMNLVPGRVESHDGQRCFAGPITLSLKHLSTLPDGDGPITLGIRPENVELALPGELEAIPGRVELIEAVGADSFLSVALDGGVTMMVRVAASMPVLEGELVRLRLSPQCLQLFDATGMRVAQQGEE